MRRSLVALAVSLVSAHAVAGCLAYGGRVQIEGTLTFHEYPGPPSYDDKSPAVTLWFVELAQPACVDAAPALLSSDIAQKDVAEIQVIPDYPPGVAIFRPVRGDKVKISGELHARTGQEQKTPVWLGAAQVDWPTKADLDARKKARANAPRAR